MAKLQFIPKRITMENIKASGHVTWLSVCNTEALLGEPFYITGLCIPGGYEDRMAITLDEALQ